MDGSRHTAKPHQEQVCKMPDAIKSQNIQPTQNDILCGRGRPFQCHYGNLEFHKLVGEHRDMYSRARRARKPEIAQELVQMIKSGKRGPPGRFLKRNNLAQGWMEVSDEVAQEKVSHALRDKPTRRKLSKSKKSEAKKRQYDEGAPEKVGCGSKSQVNNRIEVAAGVPFPFDSVSILLQRHQQMSLQNSTQNHEYYERLVALASPCSPYPNHILSRGTQPHTGAHINIPVGYLPPLVDSAGTDALRAALALSKIPQNQLQSLIGTYLWNRR